MIACQQHLTPAIEQRYERAAGPFADGEEALFRAILEHYRRTSARVVTVLEPGGAYIRRRREEMETEAETAARLRREGRRAAGE